MRPSPGSSDSSVAIPSGVKDQVSTSSRVSPSGVRALRGLALLALLAVLGVSAACCAAVGGIFKAGMWVGVVVAVIVVAVVLFLIRSISQ